MRDWLDASPNRLHDHYRAHVGCLVVGVLLANHSAIRVGIGDWRSRTCGGARRRRPACEGPVAVQAPGRCQDLSIQRGTAEVRRCTERHCPRGRSSPVVQVGRAPRQCPPIGTRRPDCGVVRRFKSSGSTSPTCWPLLGHRAPRVPSSPTCATLAQPSPSKHHASGAAISLRWRRSSVRRTCVDAIVPRSVVTASGSLRRPS